MDAETPFDIAKRILLHPNFNKLSPTQITEAYRRLLSIGVTKDQIRKILVLRNASKFEQLPRDVFKQLIATGEIQGRDLIYLCNSSPILRNYCLANKYDVNGQLIETQEIYRIALRKSGISIGLDDIPSELYAKVNSSYRAAAINLNGNTFIPINTPKYVKQIVGYNDRGSYSGNRGSYRILTLDFNGNVWLSVGRPSNPISSESVLVSSGQHIVQIGSQNFWNEAYALDKDGNVWLKNQYAKSFRKMEFKSPVTNKILKMFVTRAELFLLDSTGTAYYARVSNSENGPYLDLEELETGIKNFFPSNSGISNVSIMNDNRIKYRVGQTPINTFLTLPALPKKVIIKGEKMVLLLEDNSLYYTDNPENNNFILVDTNVLDFEINKNRVNHADITAIYSKLNDDMLHHKALIAGALGNSIAVRYPWTIQKIYISKEDMLHFTAFVLFRE